MALNTVLHKKHFKIVRNWKLNDTKKKEKKGKSVHRHFITFVRQVGGLRRSWHSKQTCWCFTEAAARRPEADRVIVPLSPRAGRLHSCLWGMTQTQRLDSAGWQSVTPPTGRENRHFRCRSQSLHDVSCSDWDPQTLKTCLNTLSCAGGSLQILSSFNKFSICFYVFLN